jgi:uncharacterized protein (TIGR02266 family)
MAGRPNDTTPRAHPRFEVEIWVDFSTLDLVTSSYVLNLSQGGVFIKSETPLPLDAQVDLVLTLPSGSPVSARGRVVWNHDLTRETPRGARGCGIQFLELPPDDRRLLENFIESLAASGRGH